MNENIVNDYISAMKWFISDTIQEKLMPIMVGHGMIPDGLFFQWDNEEKVSMQEKLEMVVKLSTFYKIPEDYINSTFNIPVEEKEITSFDQMTNKSKATTVMSEVYNLYSEDHNHTH